MSQYLQNTHTHARLMALFPGLPGWAGTRKLKPIWISLKQETMSGSGISWAICKSVPRSRQITMPVPHHSVFFTGRMPFLPPNQQRQSTEGINIYKTTEWKFNERMPKKMEIFINTRNLQQCKHSERWQLSGDIYQDNDARNLQEKNL